LLCYLEPVPKVAFFEAARRRGHDWGASELVLAFYGARSESLSVFEDTSSVWLSSREVLWLD